MVSRVSAAMTELFSQAGCTGKLCVQSLDGKQEVAVDTDVPVVSASHHTPGPVGFSLYRDDVVV